MDRLKTRVDRVLGWTLVVLMGASVVNVLWQVFTRFIVGNPSSFTDELARFFLIWIGLLGAGYAVGMRLHLAIDLLPTKLTGRAALGLNLFIESFVFLFGLVVMVIGGVRLVGLSFLLGQTSAALQLPVGYVYLVLPLSGLIMMFYSGLFIADHVRMWRGRPPRLTILKETHARAFAEKADLEREALSDPVASESAAPEPPRTRNA